MWVVLISVARHGHSPGFWAAPRRSIQIYNWPASLFLCLSVSVPRVRLFSWPTYTELPVWTLRQSKAGTETELESNISSSLTNSFQPKMCLELEPFHLFSLRFPLKLIWILEEKKKTPAIFTGCADPDAVFGFVDTVSDNVLIQLCGRLRGCSLSCVTSDEKMFLIFYFHFHTLNLWG